MPWMQLPSGGQLPHDAQPPRPKMAEITAGDTGKGHLPLEKRQKNFPACFTKRGPAGRGIGLASTFELVQLQPTVRSTLHRRWPGEHRPDRGHSAGFAADNDGKPSASSKARRPWLVRFGMAYVGGIFYRACERGAPERQVKPKPFSMEHVADTVLYRRSVFRVSGRTDDPGNAIPGQVTLFLLDVAGPPLHRW